jgi:hypothetical protein
MRLLNTKSYEFHDSQDPIVLASPQYAVLSHRWQTPKITLQTFKTDDLHNANTQTPQLDKIRQACGKARDRTPPLDWVWIDSCCIDKTNAVEESRSVNSMFEWYRRAAVCIVYLYDVDETSLFESQSPDRLHEKSEWFTRGWTLQELLAPGQMEFYEQHWKFMGTKISLVGPLAYLTGIDKEYLTGERSIVTASVATRMSWMAGRTTTLVEDVAYSMLGIFGVNMAPLYGEGVKAFIRLQKTLIEDSTDESIFAWTVPEDGLFRCYAGRGQVPPTWSPKKWGLLAPSPDCFTKYRDLVIIPQRVVPRLRGGYSWTQQGVMFQMPYRARGTMWPIDVKRKERWFPLNCWKRGQDGRLYTVQIRLGKTEKYDQIYSRINLDDLCLDSKASVAARPVMGEADERTTTLVVEQQQYSLIV